VDEKNSVQGFINPKLRFRNKRRDVRHDSLGVERNEEFMVKLQQYRRLGRERVPASEAIESTKYYEQQKQASATREKPLDVREQRNISTNKAKTSLAGWPRSEEDGVRGRSKKRGSLFIRSGQGARSRGGAERRSLAEDGGS
jgi:hypothetical protein